MTQITGAELLVQTMEAHGIEYIFTVPGAAIDPILDVLVDHGPKIILCRHEQNAAFMAACVGRITGKPGVVLATAGPGLTNIVTGIATANSEQSPVIAITGQVAQKVIYKPSHQNVDAVALFAPITKWNAEAQTTDVLPDLFSNAYIQSISPRQGTTHISIPANLLVQKTSSGPITPSPRVKMGSMDPDAAKAAAAMIGKAKNPVILLGLSAARPMACQGVRDFLKTHKLPVCATFEAAGVIPREHVDLFMGRLGVFRNQPGDTILNDADLVISIGYDLVEYDPSIWNAGLDRPILHIDSSPATSQADYHPSLEIVGHIGHNLNLLSELVPPRDTLSSNAKAVAKKIQNRMVQGKDLDGSPIHPSKVIYELSKVMQDEMTLVTDVGSHQYWIARNYLCYQPIHLLTSMGFQSMGVSLPWAIAATLVRPGHKAISISGDGSFLMCSMELETAARLSAPIIHMVWEEGTYNLVKIQQEKKYGRDSAARFNPINTVAYAESMGVKAFRCESGKELARVLQEAMECEGPCVISIPIDYSNNHEIVDDTL